MIYYNTNFTRAQYADSKKIPLKGICYRYFLAGKEIVHYLRLRSIVRYALKYYKAILNLYIFLYLNFFPNAVVQYYITSFSLYFSCFRLSK